MEIMHACPFDADDMGCVDPEGAAVAQSNPVVYNIQSAASVVASNKKKNTTTMQALYVVTCCDDVPGTFGIHCRLLGPA